MRPIFVALCLALATTAGYVAFDQAALAAPDAGASLDELKVPSWAAPAQPAGMPGPITAADAAGGIQEAIRDAAAIRAATNATARNLAIAGFLAVLFKLLIQLLERFVDASAKAKKIIPWICMALGVAVAVLAKYTGGATWIDSIILGGSGPGAVLVNELFALFAKPAAPPQPSGAPATASGR